MIRNRLKIDDTLDVFAVHGGNGRISGQEQVEGAESEDGEDKDDRADENLEKQALGLVTEFLKHLGFLRSLWLKMILM